jgi:subtilisin family serine protease
MIGQNHKPTKARGSFFSKGMMFVSFALSACVFAADKPATNRLELTSRINGDSGLESVQLVENEAQMVITKDGKVVAESTYQTEEVDIIVEFDAPPVLRLKNAYSSDKSKRLSELKQKMIPLKSQIIQAENAVLMQKRKSTKQDKAIVKREFFRAFNGVAARVQKATIKDIEKISGVRKVWRDGKVEALDDTSNQVIRAPQVWNDLGITGSGIVVAIVDTGIDYTHPDLGGCIGPACKVIAGYDFVNNDADPQDDHGHGTHCAGIVAANGTLHGVAPDARLMAAKVLNSSGSGTWSWIIAGMEWATDPDGNPATDDGADVISMSLGGSGSPDDPISQAVDNAVTAGVVVVVAAGNSGSSYESVQSPGLARKALTVGATDNYDQLAYFSSRGPVPGTFQIKPEVTAPGVSIYSTYLNGAYASMSGTSMATPHVAGAAALLRQRYPAADPEWIKNALMQKTVDLGLNIFAQGSGRIDVYASATIASLASSGTLSLGVADKALPYFSKSELLYLSNHSAASQTYNLRIDGPLPVGVTTILTPSTLTLAPGETKSFTFDLRMDNGIAPDSMTALDLSQPYDFEGRIVATAGTDTVRIPFAFFKAPRLTLQFDTTPWFVIMHSDETGGQARWIFPSGDYTTLVPAGSLGLVAWFGGDITDVKENVSVSLNTTVSMSASNAIHPLQIVPIGADGEWVDIQRGIIMRYFEVKDTGWSVGVASFGPVQGTHYFAPMSDDYLFESSMLANPFPGPGPSYIFHAHARNGVDAPVIFQNSAADFRHVINLHHIDSGLTTAYPQTAIGMQWAEGGVWYGAFGYECSDAPLASPFREEFYLLPVPYPEFHTGYLKKTVFGSTSSTMCSGSWPLQYATPLLRARDTRTLDGFWYYNYFASPQFSSTNRVLHSGIGPYSWYGRFQNTSNFVVLNWDFDYPFASQGRDERPATASEILPYELYQGGSLIQSGSFSGSYGYFSISPAIYTLKLMMNNFIVNGAPGLATVNATFDLRLSDSRPPSLPQLRLQRKGEPTETISGGELLQFEVRDEDSGIANVYLSYNRGDGWMVLSLTNSSINVYQAIVPAPLVGNLPVSLRIVAIDAAGNILDFQTQVAASEKVDAHVAPYDFDGDSISDVSIYRPDSGYWHILRSSDGGYDATRWGLGDDIPVSGDYDGDGHADMAVWRPGSGVWYVLRSIDGGYDATQWGLGDDIPVPGDYDGDGHADIAIWRPGSGVWHILQSSDGTYSNTSWGMDRDIPVPGDYDGDGKTDLAIYRPDIGYWFILTSGTPGSYIAQQWGMATDRVVPAADYDGDGKTDIAVYRPDSGCWFILTSGTPGSYIAQHWGVATDRAVPADYDGDGKTDIAVYRPGNGYWFILTSGAPGSYIARQWGIATDTPLPAIP